MNKIAYTGIIVFVTAIATLAVVHFLSQAPTPALPAASGAAEAVQKTEPRAARMVTREELAKHDKPDDCWMAIRNQVYDFTAYIPKHPTAPAVMHKWCGKDATEGWDTKDYGRPHSQLAHARLGEYLVGVLSED